MVNPTAKLQLFSSHVGHYGSLALRQARTSDASRLRMIGFFNNTIHASSASLFQHGMSLKGDGKSLSIVLGVQSAKMRLRQPVGSGGRQ
jgi:hypothetical protein